MAGEGNIDWAALRVKVGSVFTPAASIQTPDLFSGRIEQLQLLASTMGEAGRHAIVYGERGVGKTSMANILGELFGEFVLRVAADSEDTFGTLWHKVFRRIKLVQSRPGVGFASEPSEEVVRLADHVDPEDLNPDLVVSALDEIAPVVIVIDEFDRGRDERTLRLIADTIKTFSDVASRNTLVIVGVARDVTELIGYHPSIERNLRQIPMPRMSEEELRTILEKGFGELGMTLPPDIRDRIVRLSQGFPHYTHLMGKYCAIQAIKSQSPQVAPADFSLAIQAAIDDTVESIRNAYQVATMTTRSETIFPAVLLAAALAPEDEYGTFRATDLVEPIREITGKEYEVPNFTYNLGKLSSDERGNVLERIGDRNPRYRFANPLMKPYILMKALDDGSIDEAILANGAAGDATAPSAAEADHEPD